MDPRDVDVTPVAWREVGAGAPALFLHGLGMTRTGWDDVTTPLADRYRCVAWDMPGFGASPALAQPLTLTGAATAATALIGVLGGEVHLVGMSMGGMIALIVALEHPGCVRSLTLLNTSPAFGIDGTDAEQWQEQRLAPLAVAAGTEQFAEPVLRSVMAPNPDPAAVASAVASMQRITIAGLRAAILALPAHDVRSRLSMIAAPTLVAVGELDRETPLAYSEALVAGIPGARLAVIPGAGHLTPFEAPLAVARLIGDHFDTVEAA